MTILFDTSVLVAGLVEAHPHHPSALPWLRKVDAGHVRGAVCAHSVAELYSVLTTLPQQPRATPAAVQQVIARVRRRFRVVTLGVRDYDAVIRVLTGANLAGGVVYDALAARAAVKARAERILTLNRRDFERLAPLFGVAAATP